jgi:hypothetical protein
MNVYAGIATTTLQTWLTEAQSAYHALSIGKQTVSLSIGDKRVAFTAAEVPQLRNHINQLQTAIAINQGTSTGKPYSVATWTR